MAAEQFRFDDGAVYERHMGVWSRLAGDIFLDWLAPKPGLHWIDIGCGCFANREPLRHRLVNHRYDPPTDRSIAPPFPSLRTGYPAERAADEAGLIICDQSGSRYPLACGLIALSLRCLLRAFFGALAPEVGSGCHPADDCRCLSTVPGVAGHPLGRGKEWAHLNPRC